MSVTLHYKGCLKSAKLVQPLLDELTDLASEAGWKLRRIEPNALEDHGGSVLHVQGLTLSVHEKMDPVTFVFDESGCLVNLLFLSSLSIYDQQRQEQTAEVVLIDEAGNVTRQDADDFMDFDLMLRTVFCKTQFAGPQAHIVLCHLLRYLGKKYFRNLEVIDEAEYWETGEVGKLIERMNIIKAALDHLTDFFEGRDVSKSESPDELLTDLRKFLAQIRGSLPHARHDFD